MWSQKLIKISQIYSIPFFLPSHPPKKRKTTKNFKLITNYTGLIFQWWRVQFVYHILRNGHQVFDLNYEFTLWEFHRAFPILNLAHKSSREWGPSFLLGPASTGAWTICIWSNFWKFYIIGTSFTLGEPLSLVKVFRLFKLEQMFLGLESVDIVGRCITSYLLAGPTCFCLWHYFFFKTWTATIHATIQE